MRIGDFALPVRTWEDYCKLMRTLGWTDDDGEVPGHWRNHPPGARFISSCRWSNPHGGVIEPTHFLPTDAPWVAKYNLDAYEAADIGCKTYDLSQARPHYPEYTWPFDYPDGARAKVWATFFRSGWPRPAWSVRKVEPLTTR